MKKIILPMLGLAAFLSAGATGMDLQNRILINRSKMAQDPKLRHINDNLNIRTGNLQKGNPGPQAVITQDQIRAFVKIKPGFSASDLEDLGMAVKSVRGDVAIVSFPLQSLEELSKADCVAKISVEQKLSKHMDMARAASGVDDIHQGKDIKQPYTGEGVLTIIVDQGVDPNHIAFKDEEGNNRVKYLTYYDGSGDASGLPYTQYFGDDIIYEDEKGNIMRYPTVDKFYTDFSDAYHGTHTLNILAGGYKGDVSVYKGFGLGTEPNPYYGVAPDADIAVSCGDLSDLCVAMGLDEMLYYAEYRKEVDNMPSVVSMSLGSTAGPHDPNNLMNSYLAYCGEDAIIVLSAGNEGDLKIALNKTFTADDNKLQSMVYPYGYQYDPANGAASYNNTYVRNGIVMIYSNDSTPFEVKGFIMTGEPGNYRRRATFDFTSETGMYYSSDSYYTDYVGGSINSTVKRYFDGYIGGGAMFDEDLGRYYGAFDYFLYTNPETGINEDGSEAAIVGFEITGVDGQRIDCFCDGMNTWIYNYGMEGYEDGSRDGTISDMAVGENVLVVGAYNTRDRWRALDGVDYSYDDIEGFNLGDIGPYSSYGTLADGRTLPHVCAPGTAVMSAVSNPWVDYYFKGYESYIPMNTTAKATVNGVNYYWKPETGTSMSTPFVAGSIALWLQADPSLTLNDIYEIIDKTSIKDDFVNAGNPVQWGAGKFDALAGLKEVISRGAGITDVSVEGKNDQLILSQSAPGVYDVFVGDAKNLNVDVYSIAGNQVFSKSVPGHETSVDLSSLAKGIYILKVNNHSSKIYLNK